MNLEKAADVIWKIVVLIIATVVCSTSYLLFRTISKPFGIACAAIVAFAIVYDRYC
jgi:predicted PurR-regulated permease PerM